MNDDGWVKVGSGPMYDMWDEDANKTIMGKLVQVRSGVGRNNSKIYVLETDQQGTRMGVWGSTVLDARFETIPVGHLVKIEYLGKTRGKDARGEYKNYDVYSKDPNANPAATATATPAGTPATNGNQSGDGLPF